MSLYVGKTEGEIVQVYGGMCDSFGSGKKCGL